MKKSFQGHVVHTLHHHYQLQHAMQYKVQSAIILIYNITIINLDYIPVFWVKKLLMPFDLYLYEIYCFIIWKWSIKVLSRKIGGGGGGARLKGCVI